MKFEMEKYAMVVMNIGKRKTKEGIEQYNQENIKILREKKNYEYMKILEADTIKQVDMKDKVKISKTSE